MIKTLLRSAVLALTLICATGTAGAAECRKTGEVCVDGPSTKVISGTSIYRACWKYQSTYECVDPNNIDYCAAIAATPGCNVTSSTCSSTAFNGTCLTYTKTYRCGDALSNPVGVIQLDNTYTVTYDQIDNSQCASYQNNPSCQLASKVCTDGPGTKNINGLDVYKDCWTWKDYNCIVSNPVDYCMPLKQAGCTMQAQECTKTAFNSECIEKKFKYLCGDPIDPLPTNVVHLDTTYTVITDQTNNTQCQNLDTNPNCTLASQTCVDGPGTKNINGLDVYKDCWEWEKKYTCAGTALTSTCDDLKNNPLCQETGTTCVETLPGGQCGLLEHQYKCAAGEATETTQTDCGMQTFCIAGQCFDTGYQADKDFGAAITSMEAIREAVNYDFFKGEASECHRNLLVNCCKSKGGASGSRNDVVADQLGALAFKVGAETIRTWGSTYMFEALFNSGFGMLQEYAMSSLAGGLLSPDFSLSFWGASFSFDAAGSLVVGFDPYSLALSIAIYVIMDMMQCEEEEQILGMKRGQGLCHKVGSWCSKKILGACLTKKESWCCFPSKLARIVNEQGRPQIGKSWGAEKHPDCSGFTPEQMTQLRFDQMNFSEFINDVVPPSKTTSYAVDRLNTKAQSYYAQ